MANFDTIKTTIDANIKTNGTQDITGAKMNSILHQMVDATDEQLTELESEIGQPFIATFAKDTIWNIPCEIKAGQSFSIVCLSDEGAITIRTCAEDGSEVELLSSSFTCRDKLYFTASKDAKSFSGYSATEGFVLSITPIPEFNIKKEKTNLGVNIVKTNIGAGAMIDLSDVVVGNTYYYEIHSDGKSSAWVGLYEKDGTLIEHLGKTTYGDSLTMKGSFVVTDKFAYAKAQISGVIPYFALHSGLNNITNNLDAKSKFSLNKDIINNIIFKEGDFVVDNTILKAGDMLYYDIEAVGKLGWLVVVDNDFNITYLGKIDSLTKRKRYIGQIKITENFNHIDVYGGDVIVHSMTTDKPNEQVYYDDYFIHHKKHSYRGELQDYDGLCCTDFLYIKGAKNIRLTNLQTAYYYAVEFFDNDYSYISGLLGSLENELNEISVIPPQNAKYCRVNGAFGEGGGNNTIIISQGVSEDGLGARCNPIVSQEDVEHTPIFVAADDNSMPLSRIPTACPYNDEIISVCEKRLNGEDSGKISIMFSRYNPSTGENVKKYILNSSGSIRYMNPVVYYDDQNILSAYSKSIYVFAFKILIDGYFENIVNKDEADCIYISSADGGLTWSDETSLKEYFPIDAMCAFPGPSPAIVVNDNKLVLPAEFKYGRGFSLRSGSLSFTRGDTKWVFTQVFNDDKLSNNECSVAPYGNTFALFTRNLKGDIGVYFMGENSTEFIKHSSDRTFKTYTKPGCQLDVKTYKGTYFMTNIDVAGELDKSTSNRKNLCLWGSFDMKKWYPLVYFEKRASSWGYAVIVASDNYLKVLFEEADGNNSLCDLTSYADNFIALKEEYINEQALYIISNRN